MTANYSPMYYDRLARGACESARIVVPMVLDLLKPTSIVDLGCGTGIWLAEFKRHGVTKVLGIDGSHIASKQLQLEPQEFMAADLAQPLGVRDRYDLAMSLEVAEHLAAQHANLHIETLCSLAPTVLFSAAIPHQGGEDHCNEQWPAYWIERFETRGYVAFDSFRRPLWERTDVDWWYAQNLILFVHRDEFARLPEPLAPGTKPAHIPSLVHPRNYLEQVWRNRVLHLVVELAANTQSGDTIILVDDDRFGSPRLPGRYVRAFLERDGSYFGPPADDREAIGELQQMIAEDAKFLAVGWPAFWWLDHYHEFRAHLESHYPVVFSNDDLILYRTEQ